MPKCKRVCKRKTCISHIVVDPVMIAVSIKKDNQLQEIQKTGERVTGCEYFPYLALFLLVKNH